MTIHRRALAGSVIRETRDVLDLCAKQGVALAIEVIAIKEIHEAYKKVKTENVRFRYVIDMATLNHDAAAA